MCKYFITGYYMKKQIVLAIMALTAAGAQAAFVSYSDIGALKVTDISQDLSVQKFDSSLGTLNSVTITFTGEAMSTLQMDNSATQSYNFGYTSATNFYLTGAGGVNAEEALTLWDIPRTSIDPGQVLDFGQSHPTLTWNVLVSDISAFIGSGATSFLCETLTSQGTSGGGGNVNPLQVTQASCGMNIRYDYTETTTAVPEPGSLALLGVAALVGWGVRRRRR